MIWTRQDNQDPRPLIRTCAPAVIFCGQCGGVDLFGFADRVVHRPVLPAGDPGIPAPDPRTGAWACPRCERQALRYGHGGAATTITFERHGHSPLIVPAGS